VVVAQCPDIGAVGDPAPDRAGSNGWMTGRDTDWHRSREPGRRIRQRVNLPCDDRLDPYALEVSGNTTDAALLQQDQDDVPRIVIEPDGLDKGPTIVAIEDDRVMLSAGNIGYVRGIGDSAESSWYVYRRGGPLIDPETSKALGYEAVYLGEARVTRPGEPATIQVTSVKQEILRGDKLIPAPRIETINYAPRAPSTQIAGRVMSIYGGLGKVGEAGPASIITINRGKSDGIEAGHVLALYRHGVTVKDVSRPGSVITVPDERYGLVFVFRTFDRISYALVMRVSKPVRALDAVQSP